MFLPLNRKRGSCPSIQRITLSGVDPSTEHMTPGYILIQQKLTDPLLRTSTCSALRVQWLITLGPCPLGAFYLRMKQTQPPIPLPRTVVGSRSAMGALRKAPLNSWVQEWGQGKLTKELVSKHKPQSRTGVTRLAGEAS